MLNLFIRPIHLVRGVLYDVPAPPVLRSLAEMVVRVFRNFSRDDGSHMAAGVAYYAVFSLFPLALGSIAVAGFFLGPEDVEQRAIDFLEDQLASTGSTDIVTGNIEALADARGAISVVAVIGLLWTARAVFGAIHRVLNRAWKVTERPHFLLYQLGQVAAAATVAVVFLVAVIAGTAGTAIASQTDRLLGVDIPWGFLFASSSFVVSTTVFLFIYRFVPDTHVRWRDAVPAALLASLLFEVSKAGFSFYLAGLSSLDLVYGSITTLVVLMLFLYVVATVLVFGAELSSEYHRSSTSGLMVFRGQWRPVRGGLAPPRGRRPAS
ncbi:MAG: YihY/virulence factor BrkB family protein [Dehalococcoidia bacterium]